MAIKVTVLCGGDSAEREVSLRSGAAVTNALAANDYEVHALDPADMASGYERRLKHSDVVFPVLHGKGGEDGAIQSWLEERGIPYIGADSRSSALCFNKWDFKQRLMTAGLPAPKGMVVDKDSLWTSAFIKAPFVLKPVDGGSSVDTFIIRDAGTVERDRLEDAFTRHGQMLLEELIDGEEITVAVLLDEVLPVIEIIPPSDGEFDYENKYNGRTQELCPPQTISQQTQQQARSLALKIHQLLGLRDMSRTDMIVAGDGSLYVLESNTVPGLTEQSLFPKAAAVAGYGMADMCRMLVEAAQARGKKD